MYFLDSSGKPHPIRSSSQQENMHRHLNESVTGTNLSIQGFDAALTNFQYRYAAVQQRHGKQADRLAEAGHAGLPTLNICLL